MRKHVPVIALALALALGACSGGKEPSASGSPPPTTEEIASYDCLKEHGVAIVRTGSGAPRVDKDEPHDNLPAAAQACEDKAPPRPSPPKIDPKVPAAAREEAQCLRAESVSWYPDPDPATGTYADGAVTSEQSAELRTKHYDAVRKCRQEKGSGDDSVLGG
ncbi:hypothetical protein [Streptomyces sp. ISL-94]|uniref:hypothetical protein n=1 Tax=Streptomyces sp. ISL-94 TaxID=2819190 RepID=UPI001BEB58BD|nr:hypothetical protein [Streptomyces sp. ISL-94]MBT2476778.1 hypothetical protein [Streptomyces sp. ISL-94]